MHKILIRVDASIQTGTGHFMRCLSLSQHWRRSGGDVVFLMAMDLPHLTNRLEREGISLVKQLAVPGSLVDAQKTVEMAKRLDASWVVLDGYHFGSDFQKVIRDSNLLLLVFDDLGSTNRYYADIVVNQNLYADETLYRNRENYVSLLLGTSYVLLREEFSKWKSWKKPISKEANKILVSLGGSDEHNVTKKIVEALLEIEIPALSAVIITPNVSNYRELELLIKRSKKHFDIRQDVTLMSEVMSWADIIVSAGGTSTLEMAFMGLPMVTVVIADNQLRVAEELGKKGVAQNLGWYEELSTAKISHAVLSLLGDYGKRVEMSLRGQSLVDGKGAERVLAEMQRKSNLKSLTLRRAKEADAEFLWNLANEPTIRAVSFSTGSIPWGEHLKWLKQKINDNSFLLFIVELQGTAIGQIRFDIEGNNAVVSVALCSAYRGKGLGTEIITRGVQKVFELSGVTCIQAYVKPDNIASVSSFLKSHFKNCGLTVIRGHEAIKLVFERENQDGALN